MHKYSELCQIVLNFYYFAWCPEQHWDARQNEQGRRCSTKLSPSPAFCRVVVHELKKKKKLGALQVQEFTNQMIIFTQSCPPSQPHNPALITATVDLVWIKTQQRSFANSSSSHEAKHCCKEEPLRNSHRKPALWLLKRRDGTRHDDDVCVFSRGFPGVSPVSQNRRRLSSGVKFTEVSVRRADRRRDFFSSETLGEVKFFCRWQMQGRNVMRSL